MESGHSTPPISEGPLIAEHLSIIWRWLYGRIGREVAGRDDFDQRPEIGLMLSST